MGLKSLTNIKIFNFLQVTETHYESLNFLIKNVFKKGIFFIKVKIFKSIIGITMKQTF